MRRGGVMLRRGAYAALAVLILGCLLSGVRPGSVTTTPRAHAQAPTELKYTGAASCAASNCHGSTKPKPDYPKLNENIVWAQKDQHAKAYATLTNEKLKSGVSPSKIARELKLTKAEASERCLTCHAVNVPAAVRGPKFDITDGVFCDACHGPAEKWLEAHAEKGWTHEQSVKLGMYDTKNFLLRSEAIRQEAARLAGPDWDQAGTQKLMHSLTGDADAIAAAGVRAAEQAAMALDRLYNVYSKAPGNKPDKAAGEALDRLFAAIENPAKYDAKQFAAEVKAFEKNLK